MKKKRVLILMMSLFALTPALLGTTAWGIENRSKDGRRQECDLVEAKHLMEMAKKPAPSGGIRSDSKQGI